MWMWREIPWSSIPTELWRKASLATGKDSHGFVCFFVEIEPQASVQQNLNTSANPSSCHPLQRGSYVIQVHSWPKTLQLLPLSLAVYEEWDRRWHLPGRGSWTNKPLTLESLLSCAVMSKSSSWETSLGLSMISLEMPGKTRRHILAPGNSSTDSSVILSKSLPSAQ